MAGTTRRHTRPTRVAPGMAGWVLLGQTGPNLNGTNLGLFKIRFSTFFARRYLKYPIFNFVSFGADLTYL